MPQEQERRSQQSQQSSQTDGQETARVESDFAEQASGLDALLDDIESTLETNAEEYVSSFVQKGGE
ncbi:ubiquitin-like protein Pup [Bifidobacterium callimiconis]|uniref:Prokaryotic ubiquitin-like protein Pup n=1 Tax=Bifidobacterium callimiconis TaxID=2306973 RepID=A0A430FGK0_9BIFI|nr:ubiquitin-like protein Pup [Bifidobacterium callimiconis]MBT1176597.1 ubiquitin-like protein Pup [Bifidobacterium callimiconis]RSX51947.1 prokaryotic ubiquitin-like protein Pup [Bifidobacterium callimiconis]